MAKEKGILNFFWSALKITFKKHFINEWLIPLLIGFVITVVAYYSFGTNIIFQFTIFIIVTTIILVVFSIIRLNNESKSTYILKDQNYVDLINNSYEFFCTSIFPDVLSEFKLWFESEMIEKHSVLASKKMSQKSYKACRLLVFREKDNLKQIKNNPYLDGTYARRVARIHKNTKIDIAFMFSVEFRTMCKNSWGKLFKDDILPFDFVAFTSPRGKQILYANDIKKESFVNPVRRIIYGIASESDSPKYNNLVKQIKSKIYTQTNELKPEYDFCKYLDINP